MESGAYAGCHFLADSGYAASNWLLTPVRNAVTTKDERYNKRHCSGRVCIERAFGCLKGKWRLLQNKCRLKPGNALSFNPPPPKIPALKYLVLEKHAKIITVCCMLHNIGIEFNIEDEDEWLDEDYIEELELQNEPGLNYQKRYIETFI